MDVRQIMPGTQGPNPIISATISASALSTAKKTQRKLVIGSDNILWASYIKTTGGFNQVFVSYSSDWGQTWTEEQVTSDATAKADCALAIGSTDILHLVFPASSRGWYMSRSGGTWSAAVDFALQGAQPAIAVDSSDGLHFSWRGVSESGYPRAYYRTLIAGVWSAITEVRANSDGIANVALEIDSVDDVHMVWRENAGTATRILYRKKESGAWLAAEQVTTNRSLNPSLVIDGSDNVWVCWQRVYSAVVDYSAATVRERLANGTWQTETEVYRAVDYQQLDLNLSIDQTGVLTLVWGGQNFNASPSLYDIVISRNSGSGWSTPASLITAAYSNEDPILIWAQNPSKNIPSLNYALIYAGNSTVFYYGGRVAF